MVGSMLVSNDCIFSGDILVDLQLVMILLLSNVNELSIGGKIKIFDDRHHLLDQLAAFQLVHILFYLK